MTSCTNTQHWSLLTEDHERLEKDFSLRQAFANDVHRFEKFSLKAPHLFIDYSKNLIDDTLMTHLMGLAKERQVPQFLTDLFAGHPVNITEGRPVLHPVLREYKNTIRHQEAGRDRTAMFEFVRHIHAEGIIRDVVNIGIGGSDLGPQLVVQALKSFAIDDRRCHFVSNVDAHQIEDVLQQLNPKTTLFVVSSKTFTTQETLSNLAIAQEWARRGGVNISEHFVAVTSQVHHAQHLGFKTIFSFAEGVGGRFSVWSAIGCAVALVLGVQYFEEFLAGAAEMDAHVQTAPMRENGPIILALIDLWYRNFYEFSSRCVVPYHARLQRLPAYLQQLEMESNGKSVSLRGQPLSHASSAVVWGEPGSNAQHSFFQLLHQGSDVIPVEFILIAQARHEHPSAHQKTLVNAIAQAQALMLGKTFEEAYSETAHLKSDLLSQEELAAHRTFGGNRPSTTIILDDLTPRSLGALMACYEHRVAILGALWGINSFDQWGVELGKQLAHAIDTQLSQAELTGLDASTVGLLKQVGLL